ncbi:hypothetical protein CMsap09_00195 [Clavibacter michiganensis]|uniref:Uncharacterized protein n=1 Tax=Clavibacter michiganensis TaxID=28447 RepID=A0A251XPZ6_9MICO|nr:hypothetical protein CMsap09_00195 [Clavibacter michiganensis]
MRTNASISAWKPSSRSNDRESMLGRSSTTVSCSSVVIRSSGSSVAPPRSPNTSNDRSSRPCTEYEVSIESTAPSAKRTSAPARSSTGSVDGTWSALR